MMIENNPRHLQVLISNEKRDRLELLANVVVGLGHEVIAREIYVNQVGAATARELPDVGLVGLGSSSKQLLTRADAMDARTHDAARRAQAALQRADATG
jgi:hypothetical protein